MGIDDLLAAVETVEALKNAMADQVKAIDAIWEQLAWLEDRLAALEGIGD